jgi:hypothetical protein
MWIDIKDYEGIYQINELGQIRCLVTGRGRGKPGTLLKPQKQTKGYLGVCLRKDGVGKMFRVHRLVAEHFIPNPHNLPQVNHKDKDKTNNHVDNLEWMSNQQNCEHAFSKIYFLKSPSGEIIEIFNMEKWLREHPELSPRCIQNVIRGRRKSAKGWSLP